MVQTILTISEQFYPAINLLNLQNQREKNNIIFYF